MGFTRPLGSQLQSRTCAPSLAPREESIKLNIILFYLSNGTGIFPRFCRRAGISSQPVPHRAPRFRYSDSISFSKFLTHNFVESVTEKSRPGSQFGGLRNDYSVVILISVSSTYFNPIKSSTSLRLVNACVFQFKRAGKRQVSVKRERMGRNRLPIKRLTSANRRIAYSRRKKGLMKKARELSVLCGVEVFLVTFSPGGKPTVFITENSSIEDVIEKFAQLKPEERAKKKLECLEVVKKACKKFDHHVDIGELFYPGDLSVEDLTSLADSLRTQLSDTQNRLSHWMNIDKISNTDQLGKMEESLINSLQDIQRHKNGLLAQQLNMQCSDELQHVTDLPIGMDTRQVLQPSSWTQNGINQNINFDNDLNLNQGLPECSFESYTNLFCFDEELEVTRPSGEDRTNPLLDYEHMQSEFTFAVEPTDPLDVLDNIFDNSIDKHSEHLQCGSYSMNPSWNTSTSENHGTEMCPSMYPSWESTSGTYSSTLFDDQLYFPFQSPDEDVVSWFQYMSPGATEFPSIDVTDKSLEELFENSGNHFSDGFLSYGVDFPASDASFHECTVTDSNPTTWENK